MQLVTCTSGIMDALTTWSVVRWLRMSVVGDGDLVLTPSELLTPPANTRVWLLTSVFSIELGPAAWWKTAARSGVEADGTTDVGDPWAPTVITVGLNDCVCTWLTVTGTEVLAVWNDTGCAICGCGCPGWDDSSGCWYCIDCFSNSFWRCWASNSAWRAMFSRCSCYNTSQWNERIANLAVFIGPPRSFIYKLT